MTAAATANRQVSAFGWVPDFARGQVRDLRVRWALEEAGLPYRAALVDPGPGADDPYRAWQPFGQVPAYRDEQVEMFESGAIVLHIAEQSPVLCPADPAGRARMQTWLIAALNSVEPMVQDYGSIDFFHAGEAWTVERKPQLRAMVEGRFADLARALGDRDWFAGPFTAADILMVTVLRILQDDAVMAGFPTLAAYVARGVARPAFQRALAAQMADFSDEPPAKFR